MVALDLEEVGVSGIIFYERINGDYVIIFIQLKSVCCLVLYIFRLYQELMRVCQFNQLFNISSEFSSSCDDAILMNQ